MQIYKFGGASVKDAEGVRNVARIMQRPVADDVMVVVSAMGKMTNHLETLVAAYFHGTAWQPLLEQVRTFHLTIMEELFPDKKNKIFDEIENNLVELSWALEDPPSGSFDYHYDQIVCFGELLSTRIVAAYLNTNGMNAHWLDARGLIQTDNHYREARVDMTLSTDLTQQEVGRIPGQRRIMLTQGFIGGTSENFTTTLGREGSDYTAALLAYFLDAEKVTIWKDVPGVLNADPKYFKNTKKIDQLNYQDAIELTYYGASVIHPKTIKPLQNKNIPLYVRSFLKPDEPGTVIGDFGARIRETSYIFKENQLLLSIQPRDFSFIEEENLSHIFRIFSDHRVHIHTMQISAISFSVCTDDDRRTERLMEDLQAHYKVLYNNQVQLMTIRNYDQDIITKLTGDKIVLLEQRSRYTCQLVLKGREGQE